MICAMGELLIDFLQSGKNSHGYPVLSAMPGGAPANYLCAVKKQGTDAFFIGKTGDDAFGTLLKNTLNEKGINTDGLIQDKNVFTTLAFVTLDKNGDRSFSFARKPGADTKITEKETDYRIIDRCSVFHFGSLSFTAEPSYTAVKKAAEYAKSKGKTVDYDPNYRPSLWEDEDTARKRMREGFFLADTVKLSEEECQFIFGLSPNKTAELLIDEYGVSLVFATLGEKGCYFRNKLSEGFITPSVNVNPVDTTGAGDIFGGTASALILKSGKHPSLLSEKELREITLTACNTASLSTVIHGGMV